MSNKIISTKKKFILPIFLVAVLLLSPSFTENVFSDHNNGHCGDQPLPSPELEYKDDSGSVYDYAGGSTIGKVFIKTGNASGGCFGPYITDGTYEADKNNASDACYKITGINSSNVEVEKVGETDGKNKICQDISHVEFYPVGYQPTNTPTATPSATITPTVTLTPTPTDVQCDPEFEICIICPGGGTCEVIIGDPTPTPTATPSATLTPTQAPTSTPTPTPTEVVEEDDEGEVGGMQDTQEGEVLGAATLAATGKYSGIDPITYFAILSGTIFTIVSLRELRRLY